MTNFSFIAHVRQDPENAWIEQKLTEHLSSTAEMAASFAVPFSSEEWARLCGLWHDLGKFTPDWQNKIRQGTGYDLDAHIETLGGKVNHSSAGAVLAFRKIKVDAIARILGYIIAGHHAGLPDWYPGEEAAGAPLPERISKNSDLKKLDLTDLQQIDPIDDAKPFIGAQPPKTPPFGSKEWKKGAEHLHLWIRMLFSCLVDADFLDTESFMALEKNSLRGMHSSLQDLKTRFDSFMEKLQEKASPSPVNQLRKEILETCRKKAVFKPGFFSLTVPTGGGKTLSSVAFALEHALAHGKKRIIVAIPYTSIIEQTSKVLKYGTDDDDQIQKNLKEGKYLFGDENIIEHHSNIDPEKENHKNRLASENWDAPVIVTTNVQLFESLLSCRSSSCRKLHNIAESVIILDEAQMLPPEFLKPILSVLQGLVEHFGVTVVLCTATQPALSGTIGSEQAAFQGLPECTEIVDSPPTLAKKLERVRFHFPSPETPRISWEELRDEISKYPQCLAVVNTRKDCRTLHSLLPEGTIHLSAFMCGEERSDVISAVKRKLKEGQPVRVVSTQLVEAGVDIDFPVVFRAMAGLDSIAQSAGRCNREGKLNELGNVFVFIPPNPAPPGLLRKGEDAAKEILLSDLPGSLSPETFKRYFEIFFRSAISFDKSGFSKDMCSEAENFIFQFRSQSYKFRLIDDQMQKSIIIWYRGKRSAVSSTEYIEDLRRFGPNRFLLRKLQRFTVNVPARLHENIARQGMIEDISGLYVQRSPGLYREGLGLLPHPEQWSEEFLCF